MRRFGVALLAPLAAFYLVFLLLPVGVFLAMGLLTYDAFALYRPLVTTANFARLVFDPFYRGIIGLTLEIAAVTTLGCLILGYPVAFLLARTRSAWRGVLLFLVVAPLMTGVIVRTYGWIVVLGAQGIVNRTLVALHVVERPLQILGSATAVVLALVHILLPFMVFPVFSALAAQDPNLERAASTLGAGRWRSFVEIGLPLSRAGIAMGSALVFTLAAGSVVTPSLLGGTAVQMLGQAIYDLVLHILNWPLAAAMATILVVLQFAIIFLYLKGTRRAAPRV